MHPMLATVGLHLFVVAVLMPVGGCSNPAGFANGVLEHTFHRHVQQLRSIAFATPVDLCVEQPGFALDGAQQFHGRGLTLAVLGPVVESGGLVGGE